MGARAIFGTWVLVLAGCQCGGPAPATDGGGGAGGGGDPTGPLSITVAPADATYQTDGATAAMADYKAVATFAGGRTEDVTATAKFALDDASLGGFTGKAFKSTLDRGGKTSVTATYKTVKGATPVTVSLKKVIRDPASMNLPTDPGMIFGKTPVASRSPELVYPNDRALIPPNLGKLEVHFLPGNGNTVFELSLKGLFTDVVIYLRCTTPMNGGCIYLPDEAAWRALALANRGGPSVTLKLKGTDDTGAEVGESAALNISFSQDEIQGGLYYWSTTAKSIMRFDFASPTQTQAVKFVDATIANNPNGCVGCHALSRDGKKMVVEAEGATDGRIAIVDVATKTTTTAFPAPNKSFFASWNVDSTKFVGVDDRGTDFNLRVMDGTTGALVESIANTGTKDRATDHPDWSADNQTIAYASVTREGPRAVSLQWPTKGAIRFVKKNVSGWDAPVEVAPYVAGKNRYYPAIAPSSDYLVFNESNCKTGAQADLNCDGDSDPDARLFAARLAANASLVELKKANAPGKRDNGKVELTNSFPKWSPFNFQRTSTAGSRLQWVTFSSTRAYGLRESGGLTWLWMVAVDPDKVALSEDPSYPAFCLPFQDFATSNHIAQWATVIVGGIN